MPPRAGCVSAGSMGDGVLVDVIELRRQGVRLTPAQVRACSAVRGLLCLDPVRAAAPRGRRPAPLLALLLAPDEPRGLLEPLSDARVAKTARRAMLIVGTQQAVLHRRLRVEHRQAWWVRPAAA